MSLIYATPNQTCQVCGTASKGCSHDPDTKVHLCRGVSLSDRFTETKRLDNGFGVFIEKKGEVNWEEKKRQERAARERKEAEQRRLNNLLTVDQRDKKFGILLNQTFLNPRHIKDLKKRGIDKERAIELGYRSLQYNKRYSSDLAGLPGFNANGTYIGKSGYICPIQDVHGKYTGFQIHTDDNKFGKYVWTKTGEITAHLRNGELPLNFAIVSDEKVIGLTEGISKPRIAAERLGINLIGASGGTFKPLQLRESLPLLTNQTKEVIIYPDAGCGLNSQVYSQIRNTGKMLESMGYTPILADWYHWYDKEKPDIDELTSLEDVRYVSFTEGLKGLQSKDIYESRWYGSRNDYETSQGILDLFENMLEMPYNAYTSPIELLRDSQTDILDYQEGNLFPPSRNMPIVEYLGTAEELYQEASRKGFKYVLDISQTGSGKSYSAAQVEPLKCFDLTDSTKKLNSYKYFYLTPQPRLPSIAKFETDFTELPTRNNGFDYETTTATTPAGNPIRISPLGDNPAVPGNCHYTNYLRAFQSIQASGDLCGKCKFKKQCRIGSSPNEYGYLSELSHALGNSQFIAHPSGMSIDTVSDSTFLVVDEYTQSVPWIETLEIDEYEVNKSTAILSHLFKLIREDEDDPEMLHWLEFVDSGIRELLGKFDSKKYGVSTIAVLRNIPPLDPEKARELASYVEDHLLQYNEQNLYRLKNQDSKIDDQRVKDLVTGNWCVHLINICSGLAPNSALQLINGKLVIHVRNERMLTMFEKAHCTVFQDATGSAIDLGLKLGVDPSEILIVRKREERPDNLRITQVSGLGAMGNDRSKNMQERVDAIRAKLNVQYANRIGYIDWKQYAKLNDLVHLSTGRGSNRFENSPAVASVGIPRVNLSAKLAEYEVYTGRRLKNMEDKDFMLYYNDKVGSELIQECGRLRANRRKDEVLNYYILGDCDVSFLEKLGYDVESYHVSEFCYDAADRTTKAKVALLDAVKEMASKGLDIAKLTQKKIAEEINVKTSQLSRMAKKFGGWSTLKQVLGYILYGDGFAAKGYLHSVAIDELKYLAGEFLPACFFHDLMTDEETSAMLEAKEDLGVETFNNMLFRMPLNKVTELMVLFIDCLPYATQLELVNLCKSSNYLYHQQEINPLMSQEKIVMPQPS